MCPTTSYCIVHARGCARRRLREGRATWCGSPSERRFYQTKCSPMRCISQCCSSLPLKYWHGPRDVFASRAVHLGTTVPARWTKFLAGAVPCRRLCVAGDATAFRSGSLHQSVHAPSAGPLVGGTRRHGLHKGAFRLMGCCGPSKRVRSRPAVGNGCHRRYAAFPVVCAIVKHDFFMRSEVVRQWRCGLQIAGRMSQAAPTPWPGSGPCMGHLCRSGSGRRTHGDQERCQEQHG